MDPSTAEPRHAVPATISSVVCPQAAEPEADGRGAEAEEHPPG